MRVLVSSKYLRKILDEIDFDVEEVISLSLIDGFMDLIFHDNYVRIDVQSTEKDLIVIQKGVRWDWVKSLVGKVEDQPIVLEIRNGICEVIFQY